MSPLSGVDCVPVTAIAADVPGGISVESTRPTAGSLLAAAVADFVVLDGVSAESLPVAGFPADVAVAVLGGISTTMTSCVPSITPEDFGLAAEFSVSSAV